MKTNKGFSISKDVLHLEIPLKGIKNSFSFSLLSTKDFKANLEMEINKIEQDLLIVEGLKILSNDLGNVVHIIRSSKEGDEASSKLIKEYSLTKEQVEAFLEMELSEATSMDFELLEANLKACKMLYLGFL